MRIGFFLQNNKQGGLDTFILQLIQNWPEPDKLFLLCNASHPGLENLRKNVPESVKVIPYNFLIFQDFDNRFKNWPKLFRRLFKIVFWLVGFVYQVKALEKFYTNNNLVRLLVINGGYPAGDACQAATVAWGRLHPKYPAWHNFHNFVVPLSSSWLRRWRDNWIDRQVARFAQGFVSVSRSCRDSLDNRPSFQKVRREFIYNGMTQIETRRESDLRAELSLANDSQIILMLGVYEPRKGHDFIIQVMEKVVDVLPSVHLLICGYGSKEEIQVVENLRLNSIVAKHIHLNEHRTDVHNLFAQTEVLVVPSQSYESFGYTALEAMCCQVPVVVTNVGGLPEVVKDEVCGYVVNHRNVESFANRLIKILCDNDLRYRMGEQGRQLYETNFTADRMAKQYANLICK